MSQKGLLILEICDDGSLWGAMHQELYAEIEALIDGCVDNLKVVSDNLGIGEMCLVKICLNDGGMKWRRAKICNFLSSRVYCSQIELFLVDYGKVIVTPLQWVRLLPSELTEYPPLAMKYSLKDIIPCKQNLKGPWGRAVWSCLEEFCGSKEILVNAVVGSDNSVVLYDTEVCINFNEYLIEVRLAEAYEHSSQPELDDMYPIEKEELYPIEKEELSCAPSISDLPQPFKEYCIEDLHHNAFVETSACMLPVSLETASSTPVIRELRHLGMRNLTASQSYANPYIRSKKDTVLISPSLTGKTIAYLLPLLDSKQSKDWKLLILVATSWQARSVELQAKKILSWSNSKDQHRCCCAHYAAEVEAMHQLINGSDVLISTPSSALRLYNSCSSLLDKVSCIVLDDYNLLHGMFCDEVNELMNEVNHGSKPQVVALGSHWSDEINQFIKTLNDPVSIITCSIEVIVKSKANMNIVSSHSRDETLMKLIVSGKNMVICTATEDEASELYQILRINNWSPLYISEENVSDHHADSNIAVISDNTLSSFSQSEYLCHHIIHYSPPTKKSTFRLRLTLLYKAIVEKLSCICTVLLDENWRKQSVLLSEIVDRLGCPTSSNLKEMALEEMNVRECNNSGYDYCYHLKAWGHCRKYKCSSLHKFIAQTDVNTIQPSVPKNGVIKVKVSHVSNANRLWVTLLEHTPLYKGSILAALHDPIQFKKLSLDLAHYYSTVGNKKYPGNLSEGCFYGYQSDTGSYFRVQVLSFSQPLGFYFPHIEQARVRLIDVGNVEVVDVSQLLCLPQTFVTMPPQVLEVYLCGIKPRDGDLDWPFEALECSRQMLQDKVVYGRIAMSFERTLWLELMEEKKLLSDIKVSTALFSPTKELLKMNLAEVNLQHLSGVKEHLSCRKEVRKLSPMYASLKEGNKIDVIVTAVDSPSLFYVQSVDGTIRLNGIEELINSAICHNWFNVSFDVGDVCCAQFPIDNRWYRGQILTLDTGKYEVFFVDYGDVEWVDSIKVLPLHDSVLEFPFQAIECSLESNHIEWCSNIGDLLWDFTRGNVYTIEVQKISTSQINGMKRHHVNLCDKISNANIVHLLTNKIKEDNEMDSNYDKVCATSLIRSLANDPAKEESAKELLYMLFRNPHLIIETDEVSAVCQLFPLLSTSPNIILNLLRFLCGLHFFQNKYLTNSDLKIVLSCLMSSSSSVVEMTLLLLKATVSNIRDSLHTTQCIIALSQCLIKWRNSAVISQHALEILLMMDLYREFEVEALQYCLDAVCDQNLEHVFSFSVPSIGILNAIFSNKRSMDLNFSPFSLRSIFCKEANNIMVAMSIINISKMFYDTPDNLCIQSVRFLDPILKEIWSSECVKKPLNHEAQFPVLQNRPVFHPRILWSQEKLYTLLAVQINGCHETEIRFHISGSSINFKTNTCSETYAFELTLYAPVSSKEFKIKTLASEVLIKLKKECSGEWPRLTHSTAKNMFLAYDIARWNNQERCEVITSKENKYKQFCGEDNETSSEDDDENDFKISDCHFLYHGMQ